MTQESLAEKAKLHGTYIGGIERGERNVSVDNIGKIATGLGIEPMELFRFRTHRDRKHIEEELKQMLKSHDPEIVLRILEMIEEISKSKRKR